MPKSQMEGSGHGPYQGLPWARSGLQARFWTPLHYTIPALLLVGGKVNQVWSCMVTFGPQKDLWIPCSKPLPSIVYGKLLKSFWRHFVPNSPPKTSVSDFRVHSLRGIREQRKPERCHHPVLNAKSVINGAGKRSRGEEAK